MPSSSHVPRPTFGQRLARRARSFRVPDWVYGLAAVLFLLGLWEFAVAQEWISAFRFPPPSKLARTFEALLERGFPRGITTDVHLKATLQRILQGYSAAAVLAIPLGLFIGSSPYLDRASMPVITFARSVATISLLPLAVAWFGVGEFTRIFSGMRVALGMAFLVIIAAEMVGTITGLGALIMEARNFYRTDVTMVGMLFIAIIGFLLAHILGWLERILLPWVSDLEEVQR